MAEWERQGTCNGCGACCAFPFDKIQLFFPNGDRKREEFLRIMGFQQTARAGTIGLASPAMVYLRCPHHTLDNKCGIFDKPERPQMCHEFPVKPSQIEHLPCSYYFVDRDGTTASRGGQASPYPVGTAERPK